MKNLIDAGHVSAKEDIATGAALIAADLKTGAWHEIVHHPIHLLEQAGLGAGIVIGASLLAPEVTRSLSGVAAFATSMGILDHGGEWFHAAARVAHWEKSTPAEQDAAHNQLQNIGAAATDLAAGAAGGLVALRSTGFVSRSVKAAIKADRYQFPYTQLPELEVDAPETLTNKSAVPGLDPQLEVPTETISTAFSELPELWIDESAQVAKTALIGNHVSIGPGAVIGENAKIGEDSIIGARAQIGPDTELENGVVVGRDTHIGKKVYVEAETKIGSHVEIGDESNVGQFSRVFENVHIGTNVKIGQMATLETEVVLHSGSRIGSFSVINSRVIVGENSWLDSVTVEPDVTIGRNVHIDDNALIKGRGSAEASHNNASHIGDGVRIGKEAHVQAKIGDDTTIGAYSNIFGTVGKNATLEERVKVRPGSSVGDRVVMRKHSGVGRAPEKNHVPSDTVVDAFDTYPVAPVEAEDY